MKPSLFKWLAMNTFAFIGGILIAAGIPMLSGRTFLFNDQFLEFIIFFIAGILLVAIGWYYRFVDK